jgi:hypothetical protein
LLVPLTTRLVSPFSRACGGRESPVEDRVTLPFAALLKGSSVPWHAFGMDVHRFLDTCRVEGLTGLVYLRLQSSHIGEDWPAAIRLALADEVRQCTATELVWQRELQGVWTSLASGGVRPFVLKGAALAYTHYPIPSSRPRIDTDLLIHSRDVESTRRILLDCGYHEPNFCGGELFCQFPMHRTDGFGIEHKFDVHWKISTQPVFADVLTYDEVAAEASAVPALGPHAHGPSPVHALLLACVHPAMHHRNVESLLWLYDIHLLARKLSEDEWRRFERLATMKQVSAICAHQLEAAGRRLGTGVPEAVRANLIATSYEPSAAYLVPGRRWTDDLVSSVRGLQHWRARLRFLREVTFPPARYMRTAYELPHSPLSTILLPLVYVHRIAAGGWKVLAGEK